MFEKIAWQNEEERRKCFNIAWIPIRPIISCTSEQFRDIQEVILLIRYCKTLYCCRMTFTEYIYHIGDAVEMHSIIKPGLIPGGKSFRSVFFTAVNPIDAWQDQREVECDLDKPSIAPYKQTWKSSPQYSILVQFEACSEKENAIPSNSITCNYFQTLLAICMEVVCMKTGEELHCKVHQLNRLPRVTHVPNSQHSRKDLPIIDSRTSNDCESEEHKNKDTCSSSCVYFRIPSIPHSTVEQVETTRKETVRRFVEHFWKSPKQEHVAERFWVIGRDPPAQSRIKGFDSSNE